MEDLRICGSCHTLVQIGKDTLECPRCKQVLDPEPDQVLRAFIKTGIVEFNQKGGVTLREAQTAAEQVLGMLFDANVKLKLHHKGESCRDC